MRLLLVVALLSANVAYAVPVTWTLKDIVFDDGGTATGSFVYDADTNTYSDVAISTTGGTTLSGTNYGFLNIYFPLYDADTAFFVDSPAGDLTGQTQLALQFAEGLTNTGGSIAFSSTLQSGEGICTSYDCSFMDVTNRSISSGYITAVPIPAAVWLFGSALAGLGWVRRKQTV